jgi:predicted NAD/FAD-dependent oxidoreductase
MPTTPSILVVGAGLTGAAVSRALRRSLPAESIIVWEALGAVGGRMQTERVSVEGGALGLADTGAQYVTVTDDAAVATAHDPLYNALLDAGILTPMVGRIEGTRSADGGGKNYIAPAGVAAIVEHLFRVAGVRPVLGRRATGLYRAPPVAGGGVGSGGGTPFPRGRWEVSAADGTRQAFDGVVLTQPAPHMLNLLDAGDTAAWLPDATPDAPSAAASARRSSQLSRSQLSREKLRAVEYSARYALTLFFPPAAAPLFGANLDWISKYVTKAEDDALVYLSVDWAKRGGAPTEAISLVAHSSVPYGVRMMAAGTSEAAVLAELRRRVYALLPWLPPNPSAEHLQPWPLSQVSAALMAI